MKEVDIKIGGRSYKLAVREGEEEQLFAAADLLDRNAKALVDSLGQIGETRMLLMSGLVLANHTRNLEANSTGVSAGLSSHPMNDDEDYKKLAARMKAAQIEIDKLREELSLQNEAVERAENLAEQIDVLRKENEKLENELNDQSDAKKAAVKPDAPDDLFSASQKDVDEKRKAAETARDDAIAALESVVKDVERLAAQLS